MMRLLRTGKVLLGLFLVCGFAMAGPLSDDLVQGLSVSGAPDARSVLTNPAALGFQTLLNGPELMSAFGVEGNSSRDSDVMTTISYGYFGFGYQSFSLIPGESRKFSFAAGLPLFSQWFWGVRYNLHRSDLVTLGNYDTLDLGLQWRPSKYVAFGLLATRMNRPKLLGQELWPQLSAGVTIEPRSGIQLSVDALSDTEHFGKHISYQVLGQVEAVRGVWLSAGYHEQYRFQVGAQVKIEGATFFANAHPDSRERTWIAGLTVAPRPTDHSMRQTRVLQVDLNAGLSERGVEAGWFNAGKAAFIERLREIEKVASDGNYSGVFVRIDGFGLGLAAASDLQQVLVKVRNSGKYVRVHLSKATFRDYLIASAANEITIEPSGELKLLGPKAERYFLKGTLDKIGIEGNFLARGEFKSAPEMFTRESSSTINRRAEMELLEEVKNVLQTEIRAARKLPDNFETLWKTTAVFTPSDALNAKLVDGIDVYENIVSRLKKVFVIDHVRDVRSESLMLPPKIAYLPADGDIVGPQGEVLSLMGRSVVTPKKFRRWVDRAVASPRVKGIVVRVNSPGGEILASDEIANVVVKAKEEKPIVISMGDIAASGGYFLAAPGDRIYAQKLTLTGSIGVFVGKFSLKALYEKIGLNKEILSLSPLAGILSEDRPWSDEELKIVRKQLNHYYLRFTQFVAQHRKAEPERIEAAAKGRVWLGSQAKEKGLVDNLGGGLDAIREVASRAGVDPDFAQIEVMAESPDWLQLITGEGASAAAPSWVSAFGIISQKALKDVAWMTLLSDNPFLYRTDLEIVD